MAQTVQDGYLREDPPTADDAYGAIVVSGGGGGGGGGDASAANQTTELARLGILTEAAPGTDTASSGLNGRLQRIAQRLTSLIGLLPTSLGTKTAANSLAVTLASDQPTVGVTPAGNVAHDAADAGNPLKVGGRARTALPAAVAQDDRSDAIYDKFGRALTIAAPLDQRVSAVVNETDNTADDALAAIASTAFVVTSVLVTNAHATVGTKVSIRDGTTAKITGYAAPIGGGFAFTDRDGLFVSTVNTAVTVICATTGADVDITVVGYKIPA